MEGFEYVVNPPPIPKVAFGSGLDRSVLPMSGPGLNSFMRRMQGEILAYPGPYEHFWFKKMGKDYPSKLGFSVLISKIPRLPAVRALDMPACGSYDVEKPKIFVQNKMPLGGSGSRAFKTPTRSPGPANYAIPLRWPKVNVNMAFGTCRKLLPAVTIICAPFNTSKCYKCGKTPLGDYFHNFGNKLDLCRACVKSQLKQLSQCNTDRLVRIKSLRELNKFLPVRYCGFFHDHGGTLAAIQIMSKKELRKKIQCETYLYRYTQQSKELAYH